MRVLITGGTGLVGSHLARQLAANDHEVQAVTRTDDDRAAALRAAGVRIVLADVATAPADTLTGGHQFDHVVHLAQSSRFRDFPGGADDMVAVNVAAAVRLAQWCAEHGTASFTYASTGAVYASSTAPHHEDEPIPHATLGMYAASKAAAEQVISAFAPLLRTVILRPFFVYGPGMNETMLMNSLLNSVRRGATIKLFGHEDGLQIQPTAAPDAADQVIALLDGPRELAVANIVGDTTYSLRSIAAQIGELVGATPVFEHVTGEPHAVLADDTRIRALTGPCRVSLADGLRSML